MKMAVYADYKPTRYEGKGFLHRDITGEMGFGSSFLHRDIRDDS
jgi:hypothetical protein